MTYFDQKLDIKSRSLFMRIKETNEFYKDCSAVHRAVVHITVKTVVNTVIRVITAS